MAEPDASRPVQVSAMVQHELHSLNDNGPPGLEIEVAECADAPGNWTVEAVDTASEGQVYQAIFIGPRAKERAYDYAGLAYGFDVTGSTKT